MKKIILSAFLILFSLLLNAQNPAIITSNASGPTSCDGSAMIDSSFMGTWEWSYFNQDSVYITQVGGVLVDLCPGTYTVILNEDGVSSVYTFEILGNEIDCNNFFVYFINITQPSGEQSFDGIIEAAISGGTAPYTYNWSNGDSYNMIVYLNPGDYSLNVTDANGCTTSASTYLSVDSTSFPCNNFYATVQSTNTSSPSACDATVTVSPFGGVAPYTFIEDNTSNTTGVFTNMCSGVYYTIVTDASGCTFTTQYYIGSNGDTTNSLLYAIPYTSNVSEDGLCDGSVTFEVYGGTAPYTFFDENGDIITQTISNLCEGIYSNLITDAIGNQYYVTYFIASPDNIITNTNYDDSLIIGNLTNDVLENCLIDYLTLDTSYIGNIQYYSMDSIVVTWLIIDGNGTTQITEVYSLNAGFGVYELMLQIFCPQRSTDKYLIVREQFKIEGSFLALEENMTNLTVAVYPNPVVDFLTIKLNESIPSDILITDLTGKIVLNQSYHSALIQINTSEFSNGQYLITIKTDSEIKTQKIIK
jgi:hypothetical protein